MIVRILVFKKGFKIEKPMLLYKDIGGSYGTKWIKQQRLYLFKIK